MSPTSFCFFLLLLRIFIEELTSLECTSLIIVCLLSIKVCTFILFFQVFHGKRNRQIELWTPIIGWILIRIEYIFEFIFVSFFHSGRLLITFTWSFSHDNFCSEFEKKKMFFVRRNKDEHFCNLRSLCYQKKIGFISIFDLIAISLPRRHILSEFFWSTSLPPFIIIWNNCLSVQIWPKM